MTPISDTQRKRHIQWLLELTAIPTAAGKEHRVIAWIERWVADRPDLTLTRDKVGNLLIQTARTPTNPETPPIVFTAHLDHPAFVIDDITDQSNAHAVFRGGVMTPYFPGAHVRIHTADAGAIPGVITEATPPSHPERLFHECRIELETGAAKAIKPGDIATWDLPDSFIKQGRLHAPVCDDLSALAAALAALDTLRDDNTSDVRALLTLAEEVGFVGAIGACRFGSIVPGSRLLALENSRSFNDTPLGEGPIVRVGDRMSVFSPSLTGAVCAVARKLSGAPERTLGDATPPPPSKFKWRRKLMPGGACEASAYCAWGYEATCLCLALENYHNMGELDRVQQAFAAHETDIHAAIAPESIAIEDFEGLVTLLVACGQSLADIKPPKRRFEKLYDERAFVLDDNPR